MEQSLTEKTSMIAMRTKTFLSLASWVILHGTSAFAQSPLISPSPVPLAHEWVTSPEHLVWENPPIQCFEDSDSEDKVPNRTAIIDKIYEAAKTYDMPPNILYGALAQESGLIDYGIIYDLGNYSCGMAQINISEWCQYVHSLPKQRQDELGWPSTLTDCERRVKPRWLKKTYDQLVKKIKKPVTTSPVAATVTAPTIASSEQDDTEDPIDPSEFGTDSKLFENLIHSHQEHSIKDQAVLSFVKHCGHFEYAIPAKAEILRDIFDKTVPSFYKTHEVYKAKEGPADWKCKVPYQSTYYPFHTGWLIADGIYNLGEELVSLVARQVNENYENLKNPAQLLFAIKDAGTLSPKTALLDFKTIDDNKKKSTSWFRTCVVDRHITNVVNFSLDDQYKQTHLIIPEECETFVVPDNAKRGTFPISRLEFEKSRNPKFKVDLKAIFDDQNDNSID